MDSFSKILTLHSLFLMLILMPLFDVNQPEKVTYRIMDKLTRLTDILKEMQSAVLAYSGGADSTFLLKVKAFVDRLTQSILAKAFRGELVPQDPNDEPASVLLEKIKAEKAGLEEVKKRKKGSK